MQRRQEDLAASPAEAIPIAPRSYGIDDSKRGFDGPVTYAVRVDTPAADQAVLEVLDWVDTHSRSPTSCASRSSWSASSAHSHGSLRRPKGEQMDPRLQRRVRRDGWDKAAPGLRVGVGGPARQGTGCESTAAFNERVQAIVDRLHRYAREAGRDPSCLPPEGRIRLACPVTTRAAG